MRTILRSSRYRRQRKVQHLKPTRERAGQVAEDGHVRALRVLETLAGMQQPAALMAVAERSGLPKTKTYRALRDLQSHGYVDHVGRSGYRIGSRAVALASLIGPRPALLQRAQPVLARLAAQSAETATLHLRSGAHRVLVLGAEPPGNSARRIATIGERSPLSSGCGGTAILAFLPPSEVDDVIRTQAGSALRPDLAEQLDRVRREGYATSRSANHSGMNGIAAPLLDPDTGHALGSIAIAGQEIRLPEPTLLRLATPLLAACAELAPRLATVLGPSSSVRLESLDVTIQDFLGPQRHPGRASRKEVVGD
ncbi:IclR family transcriptional regulator [Pseudonocardia kujensis]|uniref:IclR family transcriptional regulator n=1 Tax=Pseudonocardia kujensis TaxID=1128675 RepID=UPI001E29729B|nr:IclR family transcriptional regulator [Pseudonocardia kujensis]MCE0763692.1 IclR family transcriptional regulator [Pseudonocardia kujensis]